MSKFVFRKNGTYISLVEDFFQLKSVDIFLISGEIRKIAFGYPLLCYLLCDSLL